MNYLGTEFNFIECSSSDNSDKMTLSNCSQFIGATFLKLITNSVF